MVDILVVAVENIWPPRQGGQVRVAGLVGALSSEFEVAVAVPNLVGCNDAPVSVHALTSNGARTRRSSGFLSTKPRIGHAALGRGADTALRRLAEELRPTAVLYTHSYLAAVAPIQDLPTAVDFANLESRRLRSFARRGRAVNRLSAGFEAIKAGRWEPRVARRADLCLALAPRDLDVLTDWGAEAVHVPNSVSMTRALTRSPENGPVLFLASADYPPNRDAGNWVVNDVWPLVQRVLPSARLQIAGRRSREVFGGASDVPGIEVVGEVSEVGALYESAVAVLAPVRSGGGQQLKVIEAMSHARLVVATDFSARSVPSSLDSLSVVADTPSAYAEAIVEVLNNPRRRWQKESQSRSEVANLPTWRDASEPLVSWLGSL